MAGSARRSGWRHTRRPCVLRRRGVGVARLRAFAQFFPKLKMSCSSPPVRRRQRCARMRCSWICDGARSGPVSPSRCWRLRACATAWARTNINEQAD